MTDQTPGAGGTRCHANRTRPWAGAGSESPELRPGDLVGKVILATPFPQHIPGGTVQPTAKGIGIAELQGQNLKTQAVQLLELVYFSCFRNNGLVIEDQHVH